MAEGYMKHDWLRVNPANEYSDQQCARCANIRSWQRMAGEVEAIYWCGLSLSWKPVPPLCVRNDAWKPPAWDWAAENPP